MNDFKLKPWNRGISNVELLADLRQCLTNSGVGSPFAFPFEVSRQGLVEV